LELEVDELKSQSSRDGISKQEVSQQDMATVVASLEPDQLASAKARSHCPRRQLTRAEVVFFWALRVYLIFMFGVVMYQLWTVAK
jgi:hypothetical protein